MEIGDIGKDCRALNPGLDQIIGKATPASKYHNARTEAAGMSFQSGREAAGVANLILLQGQYKIFALRLQVPFPLAGKTTYVADAVYLDSDLAVHIVDFKGYPSKEYRIKKRLFKERYHHPIEEL